MQKTTGKATWKTLKFSFLENNRVQYRLIEKFILAFLPPLHNCNNLSSGYLTFDIFGNNTFFGTIQKTDEKYLYIYVN